MTASEAREASDSAPTWIQRLCNRSVVEQWSIADDIPWNDFRITEYHTIIKRTMAPLYSAILRGEKVALRLLLEASEKISDESFGRFIRLQVVDEERHVEFFSRVVEELGGSTGIASAMNAFFDDLLALRSPEAIVLGSQIILEGFAKCLFEEGAHLAKKVAATRVRVAGRPEPAHLLTAISNLVGRDESRHVAFGVLYLRARWPSLSVSERTQLTGLRESLNASLSRGLEAMKPEMTRLGVPPEALIERVTHLQNAHCKAAGMIEREG
ncbi:MAG TPA: hypothetical protein VHC69_21300 [Polyangiaceae bacterium]|nr:hypothetical protein [Polyangiaceae bacterium]